MKHKAETTPLNVTSLGDAIADFDAIVTNGEYVSYRSDMPRPEMPRLSNDAFGDYLDQISRIPVLDKLPDQRRLAQYIEAGRIAVRLNRAEIEARDRRLLGKVAADGARAHEDFFHGNLLQVVSLVKRYRRGGEMADVVQEGNLALYRCIPAYDWRRGLYFSTFAHDPLKKAIKRNNDYVQDPIHVPVGIRDRMAWITSARHRILDKRRWDGDDVDAPIPTAALAEEAGLPEHMVVELDEIRRRQHIDRLQQPAGDNQILLDLVSELPSSSRDVEARTLLQAIATVQQILTPRQYEIITRRGLNLAGHTETLQEIGSSLGFSHSYVARVEAKAWQALRDPNNVRKLENAVIYDLPASA